MYLEAAWPWLSTRQQIHALSSEAFLLRKLYHRIRDLCPELSWPWECGVPPSFLRVGAMGHLLL